jgi:pantoate--beta-alanine ligase
MTMGALHEGHAALVRAARAEVGPRGQVVVTVFVNPLQFGPGEDLDRYPRTLDADVALAGKEGADVVFAPSADEVYPGGEPQIRVSAGPMGERLEGTFRPGHFDGVLTVVAKLLHLTRPDVALYGQKDAQQLALITRMVRDLNFPVRIVGVPTVREPDGLALSSRNVYLSAPERETALALSRALFVARDRAGAASGGPRQALAAAETVLHDAGGLTPPLELDYVALVDPADFTPVAADGAASGVVVGEASAAGSPADAAGKDDGAAPPAPYRGEAVLAAAAKVGATRLIDNIRLTFGRTP